MNKAEIRNKIKDLRNSLSEKEVTTRSKSIQNTLMNILKLYDYKDIFIYNSFKNEVSTKELIQELYKTSSIFLPKIIGDTMYSVKLNKRTNFKKNLFGIEEPIGSSVDINNFICIMPLLAVDESGNRIGFGKGYYDKFLKNKKCIKIGLCYDFQIIKGIPCESHDIPLDLIISDKRVIKLS